MKAIEVNRHLNGLLKNLPEKTVDRVICGDPQAEVTAIAVAWMPFIDTINEAKKHGANVMVVHEPTFYHHWDLEGDKADIAQAKKKKKMIEDMGMTIIRCHDVWDLLPNTGIPFGWGEFLELGRPVKQVPYYNVYKIPEKKAIDVARMVAEKTGDLGQPVVGFYGEADRIIKTVAIGTGCASSPFKGSELGADLTIGVDDANNSWISGAWCRDSGYPLVIVSHAVSEEPAMAALAAHLRKTYPAISVIHLKQGCSFKQVSKNGIIS